MTSNSFIVSFYGDNVDKSIVTAQKSAVDKFRNEIKFFQVRRNAPHHENIDRHMQLLNGASFQGCTLILDIDAIPLQPGVLEYIFTRASAGALVGIAQRSNHINNNAHIFCGAPCVALSLETWCKLGKPSAAPTARGDVCEEWTWRAEAEGIPVEFFYPTHFKAPPIRMAWETDKRPYWVLEDDKPEHHYGRGTFYSVPSFEGDAFYHNYQSFYPGSAEMFVETASST